MGPARTGLRRIRKGRLPKYFEACSVPLGLRALHLRNPAFEEDSGLLTATFALAVCGRREIELARQESEAGRKIAPQMSIGDMLLAQKLYRTDPLCLNLLLRAF